MWAITSCGPVRLGELDVRPGDASQSDSSFDRTAPADSASDVLREAAVECPATGAELRGVVTAPNGLDPIPGAVVYLARTRPAVQPAGVSCDTCELPPNVLGYAVSNTQGMFVMPRGVSESGAFFLVVQKGRFRRVTEVNVQSCMGQAFTAQTTRLPGTRAEGEIPNILVASGTTAAQADRPRTDDWAYDDIARVIRRLGITEFDRSEPCRLATTGTSVANSSCPFGGILANRTSLDRYNIVVAPCGALGFNRSWQVLGAPANAAIATNMRGWLQAGGRLYTSDTAYGLLAHAHPSAATFAGGSTVRSDGKDPANVGAGGSPSMPRTYSGRIADMGLRDWLADRGALAMDGSIQLGGFISPWVAIDSVPSTTRTLVTADVEWFTAASGMMTSAGSRPLTITSDVREGGGCGRVVYSSYEVDNRDSMSSSPLTPQERVLEYLLFELGGCLVTPG